MTAVKQFFYRFMQAAPFVLSNTVILVPYILFLGISDGANWLRIIPFILFYAFRMTGLFLIKGLKPGLDSFTLLVMSLLSGGLGSVLALFGIGYFPLYLLAAILLGASAAWLTPANQAVNYQLRKNGGPTNRLAVMAFSLPLFAVLLWGIALPMPQRFIMVFAFYTFLYILAYQTVIAYPGFEINFQRIKEHVIAKRELLLFAVFFGLLLLLRLGRSLFDLKVMDLAVIVFTVGFLLVIVFRRRLLRKPQLPVWLTAFNLFNGMLGNFLFLFGSLYIGAMHGWEQVARLLFLPYLLGLILALLVGQRLLGLLSKVPEIVVLLAGISFGLLLLLFPTMATFSFFLLSFARSMANSWLTKQYFSEPALPEDQRVVAKFLVQNKGSIIHQFLLMALMLTVAELTGGTGKLLLNVTGKTALTKAGLELLVATRWLSAVFLLLSALLVFLLWHKETAKDS